LLALPLLLPVAFFIFVASLQMTRGLPALEPVSVFPATSALGAPAQPALPERGASLIAVAGLGTLGTSGQPQPRPIASVTKMMTAYVILKGHPLKPGETGPTLTLTDADQRRYNQMIAEDQSALPVTSGLRLTQSQLLQGLLIASANNFAEILANWDAGSVSAFVAKMNAEAQALGMANTSYADASGLSSRSMSTPSDLLILERKAMSDPVFRSIVAMKQVQISGIGTRPAVNELLGEAGVIGIKTGFTEEAGGNLAFAAERTVAGQRVEVYGAVLGQENRPAAFAATRRAIESLDRGLQINQIVGAGQPVASVKPAWSKEVQLVTEGPASMLSWPGITLEAAVQVGPLKAGSKAGTRVGTLTIKVGEQVQELPVVLATDLPGASAVWRLTRF
jgi:D-alanyl-D-alanine carboxypeptidase (penicillin-binding protein 5/6)